MEGSERIVLRTSFWILIRDGPGPCSAFQGRFSGKHFSLLDLQSIVRDKIIILFNEEDLTGVPIRPSTFPINTPAGSYSTMLMGSSFFALKAATLTCAAIFWAISRRAFATGDSG